MAQLTQELSGGGGTTSSIKQPVTTPGAGEAIGAGLNFLSGLANQASQGLQQARQQKAETQGNIDVVSFLDGQSGIADALERGDISPSAARSRMRANFRRAAAANPDVYGDLLDANSKFMAQRGLGKVVEDETDRFQIAEKEALNAGFTKLNSSPAEREAGTFAYLEFKEAQFEMEAAQKQLALKKDQVGLASAQLDLDTKIRTEKGRQTLGKFNNSWFVKFRQDNNDTLARFKAGELTPEEAVAEIKGLMATTDQFVRSIGAEAGGDFINNMTSGYKRVHEDALEVVSGRLSLESYQNRVQSNVAKQSLLITGDPEMAKYVAFDNLLKNSSDVTYPLITEAVGKFFLKNGNEGGEGGKPANLFDVDSEQGRADVEAYTKVISDNLKSANLGKIDAASDEQLNTNVVNILRGFKAYGAAVDKPEDLRAVVKLIASPEFGKYAEKVGGIDPSIVSEAREVYQQQYEQPAMQAVREEYQSKVAQLTPGFFGIGAEYAGLATVVQPKFEGSGVKFEVVDPKMLERMGTINRGRLQGEIKKLNTNVAPIVNRLIKIGAHLQGSTDYKASYENQVSTVFDGGEASTIEPKAAGSLPQVGDLVNGFTFKGGDPRDKNNWEKR